MLFRSRAEQPTTKKIADMSTEEKARLDSQLNDAWNKLPLEGKQRLMNFNRALREMPPADRRFIQERVEHFVNMPPAEREQLRQNREKWQKMTPEQREQARREFRKRREEFEKKWRAEHPDEEPPPPYRPKHKEESPGEAVPPTTSEQKN